MIEDRDMELQIGGLVDTREGRGMIMTYSKGWYKVSFKENCGHLKSYRAKDLTPVEDTRGKMSDSLNSARISYVKIKVGGRRTLICGDAVSMAMKELDCDEALSVAAGLLSINREELVVKYEHLNNGQIKMAANNLLRNAIKRGDLQESILEDIWSYV